MDWLPHGQSAVERYRELGRKTSVSHDKLLLGAARVAVRMWWHSQQNGKPLSVRDLAGGLEPGLVCAWQAYCGEGGVLANALKVCHVQMSVILGFSNVYLPCLVLDFGDELSLKLAMNIIHDNL